MKRYTKVEEEKKAHNPPLSNMMLQLAMHTPKKEERFKNYSTLGVNAVHHNK